MNALQQFIEGQPALDRNDNFAIQDEAPSVLDRLQKATQQSA